MNNGKGKSKKIKLNKVKPNSLFIWEFPYKDSVNHAIWLFLGTVGNSTVGIFHYDNRFFTKPEYEINDERERGFKLVIE